jgi:hypothetical protein
LTAILVNQKDGVPGYLFPGYEGADGKINPQIYLDLYREQSRVFIFDWFKLGLPSEAQF